MREVFDVAVHFCLFFSGAAAIAWAVAFSPPVWRYAPLEVIASQVIRGENTSIDALERVSPVLDELQQSETCWPKAMRSAAILRGRLVQAAIESSKPKLFDNYSVATSSMIKKALSCAPSDSFLWFELFWIENQRFGFREQSIKYLERSYDLGPYEGWIGLKRNAYTLTLYQSLPTRLQEKAVLEFAALVNSGVFVNEAAENLIGPGWVIRENLLAGLKSVGIQQKKKLAMVLRRAGSEIDIPAVELPELRPWQLD